MQKMTFSSPIRMLEINNASSLPLQVYQSLVSKRIRAGEDPFPVTFCRQITSTAYETDKREGGTRAALLDLLDHILSSEKLSEKEKKKKLKKFKASYPEIYRTKVGIFSWHSCFLNV